jgi:hypothetical protein
MTWLTRFRVRIAIAVIVMAMVGGYRAMHTTEGIMGGLNDSTLSSTEFRAPIATLEAHLFATGPVTREDGKALAHAFEDLGKALDARSGTHIARYSARELRTLAGMSRRLSDRPRGDLERVRTQWMRVRSNTFDDASWFRFSEADPVATPEEIRVPLGEADRATVDELRALLDRIDEAIERGADQTDRLGEPEPSGSTEPGVAGAWHDWTADWIAKIDRIRERLPREPESSAPFAVRYGRDGVVRALDELSAVPGASATGGRPPYRVEWTRRFENARRNARAARDWIERAEQGRVGV